MSQGTRLATGYFVQYTCTSVPVKALAAAASERHHGCRVRLWYGCGSVMVVATAAVSARREAVLGLRANTE